MIDIHHHCLPGIDDGPRDMDEAVDLCAMAAAESIETIVATPHVLRGRWRTASSEELRSRLEELRERTGDRPHLLLGSEYFFGHDMVEVLADGNAILPLADSRYILVEFAANSIPPLVEQPFYRLQLDGWTPVIAHPERNTALQARPELLLRLIEAGARTQVTTASLLGDFGATARRTAEFLLRSGMVHFLATDAHNPGRRPPRVLAARDAVCDLVGEAAWHALTIDNPAAVIAGTALPFTPEPQLSSSGGLFTRFLRFLR